jgi:Undecaprenyl-phosphate glucose phosphotransferase
MAVNQINLLKLHKGYARFIPVISLSGELLILNLLFVAGFCIYMPSVDWEDLKHLGFFLYLNVCWFILSYSSEIHSVERNSGKIAILLSYVRIVIFFAFFFILYLQITQLQYYPYSYSTLLLPLFFGILLLWRFVMYYAILIYRKMGFNYRTVVIIGLNDRSKELASFFEHNKWLGYRFLGFFDEENKDSRVLGRFHDLLAYFSINQVDEVYISLDNVYRNRLPEVSAIVTEFPVRIRIVPELGSFSYKIAEMVDYGHMPVIQIHQGPLEFWYNKMMKRLMDLGISLIMIVGVLSWLTAFLYFFSLITDRQGIFFRQKRTRIDGKVFWCLKYRSMRKNPYADQQQAVYDDDRITRAGKILRKFSLDELPQFINVLMGDMSVVGPRPHMVRHTEDYRQLIRSFMLRHTVKPGITGLAQINGFRGEIRMIDDLKKRVEFDVNYIENWSLNLDIKIMLLTVWVIIRGQKQAY